MCDHWHVFAKISKGFREHQELLKFFSFLPLTSLFVCFCFSKRNPIEYRHFVFQNNVFKRSKQKIGKLTFSACLPLYFAGTSQAYFPPSRSSVAVFPVEHKGTCWRKTLAAHWEDGPFGQVRYKHKYRLLSSLLFPALSLLLLFLPIFFSVVFFVCLFVSFFLSNVSYSYSMNKELYPGFSVLRTFVPLHRLTHRFLCGGGNIFSAMVLDNLWACSSEVSVSMFSGYKLSTSLIRAARLSHYCSGNIDFMFDQFSLRLRSQGQHVYRIQAFYQPYMCL